MTHFFVPQVNKPNGEEKLDAEFQDSEMEKLANQLQDFEFESTLAAED